MSQQNVTAIIFQRDFFSKFKNKDELINLGLKQAPQEVRYLLERIQDGSLDIEDLAELSGVFLPDKDDYFDPNTLIELLNSLLESLGIPSQIGRFKPISQQNVTAIIFESDFFSKFKNKDDLINLGLEHAPDEVVTWIERVQDGNLDIEDLAELARVYLPDEVVTWLERIQDGNVDIEDLAELSGVFLPDKDDYFDPNILVELLNRLLESLGIPSQIGSFIKVTGRDSRLGPNIVKDSVFKVAPLNLNYTYGWSSEDILLKMKKSVTVG